MENLAHPPAGRKRSPATYENLTGLRCSSRLGFNVFSALPGTGSVHEGPTYEQVMKLYEKYLGVKFATTGAFKGHPKYRRGYAIFEP